MLLLTSHYRAFLRIRGTQFYTTLTDPMKAHELYANMSPELISQQFKWMREEEKELYKTAIGTLAEKKKLRPIFVTKKSAVEQFQWLTKQLSGKQTQMVGEHLLQSWFMFGQQDLLVTFCDNMEIKHDGKGTVTESLPETLDDDKLTAATAAMFDKFPANLVSLYLYVFNLQTINGWENLTDLLANDERITLK